MRICNTSEDFVWIAEFCLVVLVILDRILYAMLFFRQKNEIKHENAAKKKIRNPILS